MLDYGQEFDPLLGVKITPAFFSVWEGDYGGNLSYHRHYFCKQKHMFEMLSPRRHGWREHRVILIISILS